MIQISRDPFARTELVRHKVTTALNCTCLWCGQKRKKDVLFEYGTERDDRPGEHNVAWHKGLFCSKSCHNSYHN